jgi:hypothetical protein
MPGDMRDSEQDEVNAYHAPAKVPFPIPSKIMIESVPHGNRLDSVGTGVIFTTACVRGSCDAMAPTFHPQVVHRAALAF